MKHGDWSVRIERTKRDHIVVRMKVDVTNWFEIAKIDCIYFVAGVNVPAVYFCVPTRIEQKCSTSRNGWAKVLVKVKCSFIALNHGVSLIGKIFKVCFENWGEKFGLMWVTVWGPPSLFGCLWGEPKVETGSDAAECSWSIGSKVFQ